MNAERILKLADIIEAAPHKQIAAEYVDRVPKPLDGFSMQRWHCGSVGCIAGWALHIFSKEAVAEDDIEDMAGELLGLDIDVADTLFVPPASRVGEYLGITPTQAATVLRHLAATGEVDWSVAS